MMQILLHGEGISHMDVINIPISPPEAGMDTNNTTQTDTGMAMTEDTEGSDKESNIVKMEMTDGKPEISSSDDSYSDDNSQLCINSTQEHVDDKSCVHFDHNGRDESSQICTNDTQDYVDDTSGVLSDDISEKCTNALQEHVDDKSYVCSDDSGADDNSQICTNNTQEYVDDTSDGSSEKCTNGSQEHVDDKSYVCSDDSSQICTSGTQVYADDNSCASTDDSSKVCTNSTQVEINEGLENIRVNDSKSPVDDGLQICTENDTLLQIEDSLLYTNGTQDLIDDSSEVHTNGTQLQIDDSLEVHTNSTQLQIDDSLEVCDSNSTRDLIDDSSEVHTNDTHLQVDDSSGSVCANGTPLQISDSSDLDLNGIQEQNDYSSDVSMNGMQINIHDDSGVCSEGTQLHIDDSLEVSTFDKQLQTDDSLEVCTYDAEVTYTDGSSQTEENSDHCQQKLTHQPIHPPSNQDNSKQIQLQKEVTSLQEQLGQSKMLVKKFQSALVVQQVQSNHVITGLKQQLQRNQDELKKQRLKYDRQLGEVISHMLFLEGQLKKSKKQINQVLKEKDDIILQQKNQISSLTSTNDKLLQAVREIYGRKGKNGVVHDGIHAAEEEPLSSPIVKEKEKFKTPDKSRFSSLKDKLRRHRSSLDLSEADINVKSGLMNSRQYSSQENLLSIGKRNREARAIRDKKCRSIAGYPDGTLADLILEVPDETESKSGNESIENIGPDFEHWKQKYLNTNMNSETLSQSGSTGAIFINGHSSSDFDDKSSGSLSGSMPILSERDTNANLSPPKERPHSVSSLEQLHVHDDHSPPDKSPASSPTNTSFSEKNPFKNLKTILKRKGSKMKSNKKRTVSLSQPPTQQYQDSMKRHFEKYDMS